MHFREFIKLPAGEVKVWTCIHLWVHCKGDLPNITDIAEETGYSYRSALRNVHQLLKKGWIARVKSGPTFVAILPIGSDESEEDYSRYLHETYERYSISAQAIQGMFFFTDRGGHRENMAKMTQEGGSQERTLVSQEVLSSSGFSHISSVLAGLCDTGGAPIGIGNPSNPLIPKGIPDGGAALDRMMMMSSDNLATYIYDLDDRELDAVISRGLSWGLKVGRWNRKQLAFGVIRAIQEHVKHPLSYALAVARSSREIFTVR